MLLIVILNLIIFVLFKAAAIDLVREITLSTGEELEVRHYKRLTDLVRRLKQKYYF